MIFDKAIRRRQFMASKNGHEEPNSRESVGPACLRLNAQEIAPDIMSHDSIWPDSFEILVSLEIEKARQENVLAQDIVNNKSQGVVNFYSPRLCEDERLAQRSIHNRVTFRVMGQTTWNRVDAQKTVFGFSDQGVQIEVKESQVLYSKSYHHQVASSLVQVRDMVKQDHWDITAPKTGLKSKNMVPLLSYGAYVPEDFDLRAIGQVYACLTSRANATALNLYPPEKIHSLKIKAPSGGKINNWDYRFIESNPEPSLISEDILLGRVELVVAQEEQHKIYKSVGFRQEGKGSQLYTLIFSPRH